MMTLDSKFYNTSLRLYVFVVQRTVEQEKVLSLTVADQFINLLIRCEHKQNMVHPAMKVTIIADKNNLVD